jgi:ParB family chromosome partitioning protein
MVPIGRIHPSPLQPRTTVSLDLVAKLADSMRAGRHDPILEVEPLSDQAGHYQIVCGEQRWRAAREAGLKRLLVRIHERLGSLQRLQKQYEENRLRADLTPYEDAQVVLLAKTLRDIEVAERKLTEAGVRFQRLDEKRLTELAEIHEHLGRLKAVLLANGIHAIRGADGPVVAPLSPWRETERALGISEAARKLKLSVLRLEPQVLQDINTLPAQHAPLIARIEDRERRAELAEQATHLTHRQLLAAVSRLRRDPDLPVAEAVVGHRPAPKDPLDLDALLARLADLCRQLERLVLILRKQADPERRAAVGTALAELRSSIDEFMEAP